MATGCYIPKYFEASFKGVTFEAMEISSEHGRRGAEGEFVFGEDTGYVDMGRKIRRYNVSARFPTNDHLEESQALVAACESYGPGTLIHPTWGAINVGCSSIKITDNPLEQIGYTTAELTFVEANLLGAGLSIGVSLFGFDFSFSLSAIQSSFEQNYQPSKSTFRSSPVVLGTTAEALSQLKFEFAKVVGVNGTLAQYQTLSDFDDVIADTTALKNSTTAMEALIAGFAAIANNADASKKYEAYRTVVNWAARSSSLDGIGKTSQDAVYAATRLVGVTQMTSAALGVIPATLTEALTQYDQIVSVIDGEIAIALSSCDTALHVALRQLASDVKPVLLNRAYNLPVLVTYDLKRGTHSLVAAYELFGDAKRFSEIEMRNPYNAPFNNQRELTASNV